MPITKIALITAVIGTAILLFLSQNLEPQIIQISKINSRMLEQYVKINGNITSLKHYESMMLLTINDGSGEITAVIYNPDKNQNLTGKSVMVIGRVKEYKGKLEIEAATIQEKFVYRAHSWDDTWNFNRDVYWLNAWNTHKFCCIDDFSILFIPAGLL